MLCRFFPHVYYYKYILLVFIIVVYLHEFVYLISRQRDLGEVYSVLTRNQVEVQRKAFNVTTT